MLRLAVMALVLLATGCRTTRHVPDGQLLLDHVTINVDDSPEAPERINSAELVNYLRQQPNHRVIGFMKLQLMTYDLSGSDSTKWYNKWLRRLGQPPVLYDHSLTATSANQLRLALLNRGYMDAKVTVDTMRHDRKKKIDVVYNVVPGRPHIISSLAYEIPDSAISAIVMADLDKAGIEPGDMFDRNRLDAERQRITERLHNNGYYSFTKEYITFTADTAAGAKDVGLTLTVRPPRPTAERDGARGRATPTPPTE